MFCHSADYIIPHPPIKNVMGKVQIPFCNWRLLALSIWSLRERSVREYLSQKKKGQFLCLCSKTLYEPILLQSELLNKTDLSSVKENTSELTAIHYQFLNYSIIYDSPCLTDELYNKNILLISSQVFLLMVISLTMVKLMKIVCLKLERVLTDF